MRRLQKLLIRDKSTVSIYYLLLCSKNYLVFKIQYDANKFSIFHNFLSMFVQKSLNQNLRWSLLLIMPHCVLKSKSWNEIGPFTEVLLSSYSKKRDFCSHDAIILPNSRGENLHDAIKMKKHLLRIWYDK